MKQLSPKLMLFAVAAAIFAVDASAQDGPPPPDGAQFERQEARPNLLENLGLSKDQIRQIRIMNRDRKPLMEAAQYRLREANQALDMSIYGDALDENAVQTSLRQFQQAQAEVSRIRFQSELDLRKILTPEQLVRFRGLRARVAEARENNQQRRLLPRGERPLERIRQLPNRQRVN
ncbi:MAG: periplasmic heavy metal sensor [Pyrinomonadaceae bacterium]